MNKNTIMDILQQPGVKEKVLNHTTDIFRQNLHIYPKLGAELEFYLQSNDIEKTINYLEDVCMRLHLSEAKIENEKGHNQYEIKFPVYDHPLQLADIITRTREAIRLAANEMQGEVIFASKPFREQPGSAMHIHVSLWDNTGRNVLLKIGDQENGLILNIMGGLCSTLKESTILFIPDEEGYKRLMPNAHAPTTISWGGNNRTVAVRIPVNDKARRIEHRVPAADSDPYLVISAILIGIYYGIDNKLQAPERIYGDASLPMYNLEPLPQSRIEALQYFDNSEIIRPFLQALL